MDAVLESFGRLGAGAEVVLVEGAGSPAEINLRDGDIANMGFAAAAGVPVILIGDIDRGGVIAQLVGTHAVLDAADRGRIRGFAINKFRGDPALFAAGMDEIARRTGWAPLGLVPWFADAWRLPAEDAQDLIERGRAGGTLVVAVPRLGGSLTPTTSIRSPPSPGVSVVIVEPGRPLPGDAALVLIPGSKSTLADLAAFRAEGWDVDLAGHVRRGGHVLGLCGGYQMLGRRVADPMGIEGPAGAAAGLGLLDVETVMAPEKRLARVGGRARPGGEPVAGYEIHLGRTEGPDAAAPWLEIEGRPAGAASADGRVLGCYVHGLLASDAFRGAYLARLGGRAEAAYEGGLEAALDALAAHLEAHLDVGRLLSLAAEV